MLKRIAHITDTHLDDKSALQRGIDPRRNLIAILEAIAQDTLDEIIFTGDIGETGTYDWFFKTVEEYKLGFKIVLGNHDDFNEATKFFKIQKSEGDGELYYSSEDEFYKYIFMDSSSGTISSAQLNWLSSEITTLKKVILFIHHPVLGIATGVDTDYPLHNRDEVAQLLQASRQQVNVFCGHYHMPDKRISGKITQTITPAVSFQVKKFSPVLEVKTDNFGYRVITITELAVKDRLIIHTYNNKSALL